MFLSLSCRCCEHTTDNALTLHLEGDHDSGGPTAMTLANTPELAYILRSG